MQGEKRGELSPAGAWPAFGGWWAGAHQPPKGDVASRKGRSGGHRGWKGRSRRPSRVQFTAERLPRRPRGATTHPIGSRLGPQPSTATAVDGGPRAEGERAGIPIPAPADGCRCAR